MLKVKDGMRVLVYQGATPLELKPGDVVDLPEGVIHKGSKSFEPSGKADGDPVVSMKAEEEAEEEPEPAPEPKPEPEPEPTSKPDGFETFQI